MLNGVWFKKKMVQSSGCLSAPSGSIKLASKLMARPCQIGSNKLAYCVPFIGAQGLGKLVGELRATVNVEVG